MEMAKRFKYFWLRTNQTKQAKSTVKEQYKQRVKLLTKFCLIAGNFIKAFNTYSLPVLRYSFGILKWSSIEQEYIQRPTRTMFIKSNNHHPKVLNYYESIKKWYTNQQLTILFIPKKLTQPTYYNFYRCIRQPNYNTLAVHIRVSILFSLPHFNEYP